MAINRVEFFIYTALVLFLQNEIGFALRFDITPNEVYRLIHNDVCISCELETSDSDVREIMLLELSKDNVPIALLRQNANATVEKGLESQFWGEGKIYKSVHTSYIRVILSNPDIDDSGEYTCQMYYLDQLHALKDARKSSNLSVSDIKSVVTHLENDVSSLKKELAVQKNQHKKEFDLQKGQISHLQNQANVHEQNLQQIGDTASFTTAFSVESPITTSYGQGDTILFTKSTLNVRGRYNMDTGVFTAPRRGLYVFYMSMTITDWVEFVPQRDIVVPNATVVRLVGGSGPWEGRVEISRGGLFGTVCDDAWDSDDAAVICRMLGYTGGTAYQSAHFGQGLGNILLDNVNCFGNELDVFHCRHNGWGVDNCGHDEDASVMCDNSTNVSTTYEGSFYLKVNDKIVESTHVYNQSTWESRSISTVIILNAGDRVKPVADTNSNLKMNLQYTDFYGYLLKLL